MRARSRRLRGQAAVEMALGLLVFVTIFIFGMHFAEVGFLSLKVQEATNAAVWDSTSRKMHNAVTNDYSLWSGAVTWADTTTDNRYKDLDGLRNAGTGIKQVFTRADNFTATCTALPGGSAGVNGIAPVSVAADAFGNTNGDTGIACATRVRLSAFNIPQRFVDGANGLAQERYDSIYRNIYACGVGRAVGGSCPGQLGILLDDWGLAGAAEAGECDLYAGANCGNKGFYRMANAVYGGAGSAGSDLVNAMLAPAGSSPISEGKFWFSFKGSESGYTQNLSSSHGSSAWQTSPWSAQPEYTVGRGQCFLGHGC
jgi:hypothetical protein